MIRTASARSGRVYEDLERGLRVPGVTTVCDMKAKPALVRWAALECGRYVEGNAKVLAAMDPAEARDAVKGAPWRRSGAAAGTGTDVHAIVERILRGEKVTEVDADLVHPVRGFLAWRREFAPEPLEVEACGWNETLGYAGTLDLVARIDGVTWLVDVKTSKAVYGDYALQLAAYQHFEHLVDVETGRRRPMPKVDGCAVLHLPKEEGSAWSFTRVDVTERELDAFRGLLAAWQWEESRARSVVGRGVQRRDHAVPF